MKTAIKGFTLLELMVTIAIVGILTALSLPSFLKLQAKAKQTEAKTSLRALYDLQTARFQEFDSYSSLVGQLGFSPDRGNRYSYLLVGSGAVLDSRSGTIAFTATNASGISVDTFAFPTEVSNPTFVPQSGCTAASAIAVVSGSAGSFTAAAVGNVDSDATLDEWTISSFSRDMTTCADVARGVPSGTPVNEFNDVAR
jgi:type IV pilus assembly protein PilA